jgi:ABC-type antimicrobial peptide transport system permease subunit
MTLVALGLGLGLVACLVTTRFLESLLFRVDPLDLGVLSAVMLLFLGVAAAANYLPARRATRVDPLIALRPESG